MEDRTTQNGNYVHKMKSTKLLNCTLKLLRWLLWCGGAAVFIGSHSGYIFFSDFFSYPEQFVFDLHYKIIIYTSVH